MLEGILGKKIGMTHIFLEDGSSVPVTVIKTGPCFVVQKKTVAQEGYNALQIGFCEKKEKRTTKPLLGHFKKAETKPCYHLREFECSNIDAYQNGQTVSGVDIFKVGDFVDVSGRTKGRGFSGVVKRWNFAGGAKTHGSMFNRAPGSIGSSSDPSRTYKGHKHPGHYGNERLTVENLRIVGVRGEENVILVKGAVPGTVNSILELKKAKKKG